MGNVKIDHQLDVVDVDTTRDDIRSHQYIYMSALELLHDLFPLALLQIGVHGRYVELHTPEGSGQLLDLHL